MSTDADLMDLLSRYVVADVKISTTRRVDSQIQKQTKNLRDGSTEKQAIVW